ncbi:DUF3331 domain-containing protein [Paraburkholderia ferrariae]|uniref:DUF3331 domain-containing protein n=1 Tax=Paraburkholderia ferrariae TaxID=386056 RepID=UPI0005A71051|nr:DUF3331 domain-containing protein [Paraburkholderia ferrariae]
MIIAPRDPKWAAILDLLNRSTSPLACEKTGDIPATQAMQVATVNLAAPTIRLIDRIDLETVLLSWSDPQAGFCGEEKWKIGAARRAGPCILTRIHVRRRDRVYQPALRWGRRHEGAMILPGCIERAAPGELLVPTPLEPDAEIAMMPVQVANSI